MKALRISFQSSDLRRSHGASRSPGPRALGRHRGLLLRWADGGGLIPA